jgi:hypothetical protein
MKRFALILLSTAIAFGLTGCSQLSTGSEATYTPKRINKCIELLEQGQPIYYDAACGGYELGRQKAQTWGDYIIYNMEHNPLDFTQLREFMRGLVDGGPTPSGHRTPTVIAIVPVLGMDEETMMAGSWMVQQALAQGVHGVHLVRARDPEAAKKFVQAARYPVHKQAIDVVGEGLRGWGSHKFAAWVWGLDEMEYLRKADVWPLNPNGELMILKRAAPSPDWHSLNTDRATWVSHMVISKAEPILQCQRKWTTPATGF